MQKLLRRFADNWIVQGNTIRPAMFKFRPELNMSWKCASDVSINCELRNTLSVVCSSKVGDIRNYVLTSNLSTILKSCTFIHINKLEEIHTLPEHEHM